MRALATGATGFVGGRLVSLLAGRGDEVRALVRDRSKGDALEADGISLHEGDVLDSDSLAGAGEEATLPITSSMGWVAAPTPHRGCHRNGSAS